MRSLTRIGLVAFLLCLGLAISGCVTTGGFTSDNNDDTVLVVGVAADYPPVVYKEGDRVVGLEAELARKAAAALGQKLRFEEIDWADLMPALEAGAIDVIMSGMSVTKSRSMRMSFVRPYVAIGQMALVRRADRLQYLSPYAVINNRGKIAVVKGTTGAYLAEERITSGKIVQYDSVDKAVRALAAERVDLLIHDSPLILWLGGRHEADGLVPVEYPLTTEYLAWAVSRSNRALQVKLNALVQQWHEDGSLEKIVKHWIPVMK